MYRWPALFVISVWCVVSTFGQNALDGYAGKYNLTGVPLEIVITVETGKLMIQATGQPKAELAAVKGDEYEVVGAPIKFTFVRDKGGTVSGLVVNQGGQDYPATKAGTSAAAASADKSPHKSTTVSANGIKMHYLDWGGTGEVMLLLAGFGNDAHIFDEFATRFTDKFRVIALTRRGFGETDRPASGYDTATRVEDIRAFMDAMKIDKADLVGHSLAGDELTAFAVTYPSRANKIVYLDAAYDRSALFTCKDLDPPGGMPPLNKKVMADALKCPGASEIVVKDMPPADFYNVMTSTIRTTSNFHPEYTKITVPALAIYADPDVPQETGPMDDATRQKFAAWWKDVQAPLSRQNIDRFRREVRSGKVVEIKGATHYVFVGSTRDQTVAAIREFLIGSGK